MKSGCENITQNIFKFVAQQRILRLTNLSILAEGLQACACFPGTRMCQHNEQREQVQGCQASPADGTRKAQRGIII